MLQGFQCEIFRDFFFLFPFNKTVPLITMGRKAGTGRVELIGDTGLELRAPWK